MRPRPDAMRPRSRLRPERVWLRPNDLASRPHGPRGINTPGSLITKSRMPGLGKPVRDCDPYTYHNWTSRTSGFASAQATLARYLCKYACLRKDMPFVLVHTVVKVDRRIRWHYTTTILRLRIGARLTRYRNCKFHNSLALPAGTLMASAGTPYRLVPAHFYPCVHTRSHFILL